MIYIEYTNDTHDAAFAAIDTAYDQLWGEKNALDNKFYYGLKETMRYQTYADRVTVGIGRVRELVRLICADGQYSVMWQEGEAQIFDGNTLHVATVSVIGGQNMVLLKPSGGIVRARYTRWRGGCADHSDGSGKEYVLDRFGVPTRRFAYCVKKGTDAPEAKWVGPGILSRSDELPGNEAVKRALSGFLQGTNDLLEPNEANDEALKIAVFLHYERQGKLGVCLSSSPKRLRDNKGQLFMQNPTRDTYWVIDLARIPTTTLLVNLYANPANLSAIRTMKPMATMEKSPKSGSYFDIEHGIEHMRLSVIKNRELYVTSVPSTACMKVILGEAAHVPDNWNWAKDAEVQRATRELRARG